MNRFESGEIEASFHQGRRKIGRELALRLVAVYITRRVHRAKKGKCFRLSHWSIYKGFHGSNGLGLWPFAPHSGPLSLFIIPNTQNVYVCYLYLCIYVCVYNGPFVSMFVLFGCFVLSPTRWGFQPKQICPFTFFLDSHYYKNFRSGRIALNAC